MLKFQSTWRAESLLLSAGHAKLWSHDMFSWVLRTLIQITPRSLGSWCIKATDESVIRVDSPVPLMYYDPSDPDPDHPKGTHPLSNSEIV